MVSREAAKGGDAHLSSHHAMHTSRLRVRPIFLAHAPPLVSRCTDEWVPAFAGRWARLGRGYGTVTQYVPPRQYSGTYVSLSTSQVPSILRHLA